MNIKLEITIILLIDILRPVEVFNGKGIYNSGSNIPGFRPAETQGKCEPITIPMCKDIQYNETIMPNLMNHQRQDDAGLEVHQFFPLVKVQCSPYLKFFLCTMYAPVCTVLDEPIPPCRSLCIEAKSGCEGLMNKFGFVWPENLDCAKFPESGLCVGENRTEMDKDFDHSKKSGSKDLDFDDSDIFPPGSKERWENPNWDRGFECLPNIKVDKSLRYHLQVGDQVIEDCGLPCSPEVDMFFGPERRKFAWYLIGIASAVCLLSTLFTLVTFLVDMQRFRYPERPIIFLSGCYFAWGTRIGYRIYCWRQGIVYRAVHFQGRWFGERNVESCGARNKEGIVYDRLHDFVLFRNGQFHMVGHPHSDLVPFCGVKMGP